MSKSSWSIILIAVGFLFSCSKTNEPLSAELKSNARTLSTLASREPFPFDWENSDTMPTPVDHDPILVPWSSGVNQAFPEEFNTDYKKIDGWELIYNSFSENSSTQPLYFGLYNKYRGVLRMFIYLKPSGPIPSNNIMHSFHTSANLESPMLNFAASEIVNVEDPMLVTNQVQPYQTAATGTWYAFEQEITYDPEIHLKEATSSRLLWTINSVSISNINLFGHSEGKINGTITQPNSGINVPALVFNTVSKGALTVGGLHAIEALSFLNKELKDDLTKSLNDAKSGVVKNLFSGIIGGKGGGTSMVDLKFTADHTFEGTMTNNFNIGTINFYLPGTKNLSDADGEIPGYKKRLGIFNLKRIPEVKGKIGIRDNPDADISYAENIKLDESSIEIEFNPDIINSSSEGAQIKNLKNEIVTRVFDGSSMNQNGYWKIQDPIADGSIEIISIAGEKYGLIATNIAKLPQFFTSTLYRDSQSNQMERADNMRFRYEDTDDRIMKTEYLKISFDVVPNNGAAKTTIVKTFNIKFAGDVS